jgi:predicted O-methyltransferase YrrM
MNTVKQLATRALACLRERRLPDRVLAWQEARNERHGAARYQRLQQKYIRRTGIPRSLQELHEICETALAAGAGLPMDGIVYGPAHWESSGVLSQAPAYYNFLAGFVRSLGLKTIVEVGTWYGGSTQALARGFAQPGRIVTIDVSLYNPDGLSHLPAITRITGDAAAPEVLRQIQTVFQAPIDLLYLDGDHRYESNRDILRQYGAQLRPQWVILDDIHWQWPMEKLWARALRYHGAHALDAGSEFGFRRPGENGNGFGVIDLRGRSDYRI